MADSGIFGVDEMEVVLNDTNIENLAKPVDVERNLAGPSFLDPVCIEGLLGLAFTKGPKDILAEGT